MKHLMLWLVFGGLVGTANSAFAGDHKTERESLRGIKQFYVVVENLDSAAVDDGLNEDQMKVAVELRLRKAGLQLVEDHASADFRCLYVDIDLFKAKDSALYAHHISVEFRQPITVDSNRARLLASTWSATTFGTVGSVNMVTGVRNAVGALVDTFLNAYLSVNPPKP
jgi:hypothetical protein